MPRWVVNEAAESSSEEDEPQDVAPQPRKKLQIHMKSVHGVLKCHVCGKEGHQAGFVGSVYVDCPNKPCYLCKTPGHTTATCPHRAPETGCSTAVNANTDVLLLSVMQRQCTGRLINPALPVQPHAVEAAVLKLHSRRCTWLEFHPTQNHLVLSGDKKGQVAVWDWQKVYERTVYTNIHTCLVNAMRFLPSGDGMSCVTASSDGMCKIVDIETGCAQMLSNLNPNGWIEGVTTDKTWGMFYGMDVVGSSCAVAAGDTFGRLHLLDTRCRDTQATAQVQKRGTKMAYLHSNPTEPNLFLSCGGDHVVRLLDLRRLPTGADAAADSPSKGPLQACAAEIVGFNHCRAINSATFSPRSGSRIMTTCQDNRIRIWDSIYRFGDMPDREIVHSHDFNRYLTPFRAEWDPKDPQERTFVVGRYISEDFGGVALHPVDILDASTGQLLAELTDPNLQTICPVNKPHPRMDVIITGSSRSLYAWKANARDFDSDNEGDDTAATTTSLSKGIQDLLRGSSHFISFDADEDTKRTNKAKLQSQRSTAGMQEAARGGSQAEDAEADPVAAIDRALKKKLGGKPKTSAKAKAHSAAASQSDDEGDEGELPVGKPPKGKKKVNKATTAACEEGGKKRRKKGDK